MLDKFFNLEFSEVYATDVFPFVKAGDMGTKIPMADMVLAAKQFAIPQIKIISPKLVVCLGRQTFNSIRKASGLKEVSLLEPFEKNQVGSSAMAYKRNPMLSERTCSLSRYLMGLPNYCSQTSSNQWLERTLDDSAIRRITIPEAFLTADSICNLLIKITNNLVVWPAVINKNINNELPFMATEIILMKAVKKGGDRQILHEAIRKHSIDVTLEIKKNGKENNLIERIKKDPLFKNI